MSRVRVALMCQHLTMGGAEELLFGIATHLPSDRYDVRVLCLTQEGIVARELRTAGVHLDVLPGEPGARDPFAMARLVQYLRHWRPAIVHTFLLNACIYGRLAAVFAGVPRIFAAEQNMYRAKAKKHVMLERLLAMRTYRVIACCEVVGTFYQQQVGIPKSKMAVILNAVRYDQFLPLPDKRMSRAALNLDLDAPTLGVIGRLTRQKGHDTLFQALHRLSQDHPTVQLAVAGQGDARQELEGLARNLGIADRVRFLGVRRDREHLYGAFDVFTLPSRWEGLSLALAEAVGAGIPTVATDVGGNAEVIDSGTTGLIVPAEDVDALTTALDRLLRNAALRDRFSKQGLTTVQPRFGIARHVEQLDALYTQALEDHSH